MLDWTVPLVSKYNLVRVTLGSMGMSLLLNILELVRGGTIVQHLDVTSSAIPQMEENLVPMCL